MDDLVKEELRQDYSCHCDCPKACTVNALQKSKVCVPVTVSPCAYIGDIRVECCGDPVVRRGVCEGTGTTECTFSVTQIVAVNIPITFGAKAVPGDPVIICGPVGADQCDCMLED